jgi:hypothetical protein
MKNFVAIIDGEVAVNLRIPEMDDETQPMYLYFEKIIAALSSDPIIIATEEPIEEGSSWDGNSFTAPVE